MIEKFSICPICKVNPADKTNCHIIPWFIIKKSSTKEGVGIRGMETQYTITPDEKTKLYLGQGILPETIEEYVNNESLDQEKENTAAVDYLFCTSCEKYIGELESIFAQAFPDKKFEKILIEKDFSIVENAKISYTIYELFIQSIFFRCGITNSIGFKIAPEVLDSLQKNLCFFVHNTSLERVTPSLDIELPRKVPVFASRFFEDNGKDPTEYFTSTLHSKLPYFIYADRWQFYLFAKQKNLKSDYEHLFGLSKYLNKPVFQVNHLQPVVYYFSKDVSDTTLNNIAQWFAGKRITFYKRKIRSLHEHFTQKRPDENVVNYIGSLFIDNLKAKQPELKAMVNAFATYLGVTN